MRFETTAIILVGFLLSHAAGLLFYSFDRREALEMTEAIDLAERAAGISRLVRDLPYDMRSDVIRSSDSRIFRVWAASEPAIISDEMSEEEAEILAYLRSQVPRIADNAMLVRLVGASFPPLSPPPFDQANRAGSPPLAEDDVPAFGSGLAISIRHPDSEWINFLGMFGSPRSLVPELFRANIASAIVGLALVAFWLVDRVTRPLGRFASAAEELGRDLFRPPLEVSGPQEVMIAAKAFNRMQMRLKRLIQSRTEFLAAISHDLHTPLTHMRLRLEVIPELREREKMLRSIDEMNEVIESFLSFARAGNDLEVKSKVDLRALVSSICDELEEIGNEVICEAEANLILRCKRLAVKRAVLNIVDNALKYGKRARVSAFRSGEDLVVRVEDDGEGIPESEISTALRPFQRLAHAEREGQPSGSGLGLAIASAIMEDHGGQLSIKSSDRSGLVVELIFPV